MKLPSNQRLKPAARVGNGFFFSARADHIAFVLHHQGGIYAPTGSSWTHLHGPHPLGRPWLRPRFPRRLS